MESWYPHLLLDDGVSATLRDRERLVLQSPCFAAFSLLLPPTFLSHTYHMNGNSEHFPQNRVQIWSLDMYVLVACNSWHTFGGFKEYLPTAGLEAERPAHSCRIWRSTSLWRLLPSESHSVQGTSELWNGHLTWESPAGTMSCTFSPLWLLGLLCTDLLALLPARTQL